MARGQPERRRLPGWGCVPCRCEKALDWDLYFCGSYGKIGKRLFDVGGSRFQGSTPGRSARRIAGDSGDRSEALKGRGMSRETKKEGAVS